jgi:hypothetical protein
MHAASPDKFSSKWRDEDKKNRRGSRRFFEVDVSRFAAVPRSWFLVGRFAAHSPFTIHYSLFTIQALRLRRAKARPPSPKRAAEDGSGTAVNASWLTAKCLSALLSSVMVSVPAELVKSVKEM